MNTYVDFDGQVDLPGLLGLNDYLMRAISESHWYIGLYANGREDGLIDCGVYEEAYQRPELKSKIEGMSFDARQRYFLLAHNAGHLGYSVRLIHPVNYESKHDPRKCVHTPDHGKFGQFFQWLNAQDLFAEYGRVTAFISPAQTVNPPHHDYKSPTDSTDEFIWLRTNKSKVFGLYDDASPRNFQPIESYCAWFNNGQYHGGPLIPATEWSFSIRVDGVFSDRIRKFLHDRV